LFTSKASRAERPRGEPKLAGEGKLRVLAVTSKTRSPALPDVPTMAEAGYADIEGENWQAFLVPAGTPKEIIIVLHREIMAIIALPDVKERLATLGLEAVGTTPEECAAQGGRPRQRPTIAG
jgi:tripartite-type tricarboxylate transporter receptor subunit TctC